MAHSSPVDPSAVRSRTEFTNFIDVLRTDLRDHPDEWENSSLEQFLEAMGTYIGSMGELAGGRFAWNLKLHHADWMFWAQILWAARSYK